MIHDMNQVNSSASIPALLRSHFPQLGEPALQQAIAEVGQVLSFEAGEKIMDYGSYIRMVPLLVEGSIKVMREEEDGRELFLYFLESGQTCSMSFSCCMAQKKSTIRTVAEDATTMIGVPVRYVDEWMSRFPTWKNFVMRSYDQRFNELLQSLDSIAFKQMDRRLWEYLVKRAEANQSQIIHSMDQAIASDLNASREAISRLLKQLEKLNRVKLSRNQIELLD